MNEYEQVFIFNESVKLKILTFLGIRDIHTHNLQNWRWRDREKKLSRRPDSLEKKEKGKRN